MRVGAALALLLGAAAQGAPKLCENQPIVIDAKPLEIAYRNENAVFREVVITQCDIRIQADEARVTGGLDTKNSRWTISGNVKINAEGGSLSSDKAIVTFRNNLISAATITGTPAEFQQLRDDGTTARGHANSIDYETTNGTVTFNENAWLSDGRNEISGPQFGYNIRTQSYQGQTRPSANGSGAGRVRIVIQPDKPPAITPADKEKKP